MIEIQDVTYRYDENQIDLALNHVSLDIHEGEFTVILGHNGSEIGRASCRERVWQLV